MLTLISIIKKMIFIFCLNFLFALDLLHYLINKLFKPLAQFAVIRLTAV